MSCKTTRTKYNVRGNARTIQFSTSQQWELLTAKKTNSPSYRHEWCRLLLSCGPLSRRGTEFHEQPRAWLTFESGKMV
jgi:hypothetical protein